MIKVRKLSESHVPFKSAAKALAHFTDVARTGCFPYTTLNRRAQPVFWIASKSLVEPY